MVCVGVPCTMGGAVCGSGLAMHTVLLPWHFTVLKAFLQPYSSRCTCRGSPLNNAWQVLPQTVRELYPLFNAICVSQEEQNNRATYWQVPAAPHYIRWKGLSAGATAESVALHPGRPIMRPVVLPNRDTYARSIARFTANLKGKFKQLAQARASPSYLSESVAIPQPLPPVQRPAPAVHGMSAAAPRPFLPPAHNLTGGLNGRPAASFNAAQTAAHHSMVANVGLASAAGSAAGHSIPFGQAVASQPAAVRPTSMAHNLGPFNIGSTGHSNTMLNSNSTYPIVQQHM